MNELLEALKKIRHVAALGSSVLAADIVILEKEALAAHEAQQAEEPVAWWNGKANFALVWEKQHAITAAMDCTIPLYTRPQAIPEWRPIETAPKTGRTILLGYFNSHGNWRTLRGQWFSEEAILDWEEPEDFDAGWYETSVEADDPPNCWATDPTHWMPLPSAPEPTK